MNFLQYVLSQYLLSLSSHPLETKVITSTSLTCLSNALIQAWHGQRSVRTLAVFGAWGATVGTVLHLYFGRLQRVLGTLSPMPRLVLQLAADSLILQPALVAGFWGWQGLAGGQGDAVHLIRTRWWPTLVSNYRVFIPAALFNYTFVPVHLRVLVNNLVAFVWNAYLSQQRLRLEQQRGRGGGAAAGGSESSKGKTKTR
jgi:hypothetical protein